MRLKSVEGFAREIIELTEYMLDKHHSDINEKDNEIEALKKHIDQQSDEINDLCSQIEKLEHDIAFDENVKDLCSNK